MPDVSIVIKATDRYSDSVKTMSAANKAFSKDLDGMQAKVDALSKTKAVLQVDVDKAKKELTAARKQFVATGEGIDELEKKQLTFDTARRNLALVTKEADNTAKQMAKTEEAFSKLENTASGGFGFSKGVINALAVGGIGDAAKQILSQGANAAAGSLLGDAGGTLFSSALSTATTGASAGFMVGGPAGAAIGAAIGAGVGLVSGGIQNFEKKDDAFKSYYQEAYETQISEQESSPSTGSALAAQRETDKISFSTLFKDAGTADAYLSNLVEMANDTPFLYDDLTSMSKTLAAYGYSAQVDAEKSIAGEKDFNYILDVLETIGDTGAALGQSTSDMSAVATALGRMKSSSKTTLEYLNILNDRGIGAVGMLADAYGVDQGPCMT